MKLAIAIAAGLATAANADVTINEVVASTTGADVEFIELYNTGGSAIDLTGWSIELWESDTSSSIPGQDAAAPYILSGSVAAGDYFTLASPSTAIDFGFTADQIFGSNAIENSSFTMILKDAGGSAVETIFFWDGGEFDFANDNGNPVTPDLVIDPDGTFLAPGFYRAGDGSDTIVQHDFNDFSDYTPDAANLPAPAGLAVAGLGLIAAGRRRR